jgi:hypothetical protein
MAATSAAGTRQGPLSDIFRMAISTVLIAVGLSLSLVVGSVYGFMYWRIHRETISASFKNFKLSIYSIPKRIKRVLQSKSIVTRVVDSENPYYSTTFRLSGHIVTADIPGPEIPDIATFQDVVEPESAVLARTNNFFDSLLLAQEKEAIGKLSDARTRREVAAETATTAQTAKIAADERKNAAALALMTFCEKVSLGIAVEDFYDVDQLSLNAGELVVVVAGVGEVLTTSAAVDVEVKILTNGTVAFFARVALLPRPLQAQIRALRRDFQEADYALIAADDSATSAYLEGAKVDEEISALDTEIAQATRVISNQSALATKTPSVLPGPPLPKKLPQGAAFAASTAGAPSGGSVPSIPVKEPPAPMRPAQTPVTGPADAFPSVTQLHEWDADEEAVTGGAAPSYRRAARAEKQPEVSMEERLRREREKQDEYAKAYSEFYRDQAATAAASAEGPAGFFFQPGAANGGAARRKMANTPKVSFEADMDTWEGKTVYALKKEIVKELEAEVLRPESTAAQRRTIFKQLSVRYHPDKNPESRQVAKRIFQFIQSIKDWFLTGLVT